MKMNHFELSLSFLLHPGLLRSYGCIFIISFIIATTKFFVSDKIKNISDSIWEKSVNRNRCQANAFT